MLGIDVSLERAEKARFARDDCGAEGHSGGGIVSGRRAARHRTCASETCQEQKSVQFPSNPTNQTK